MNTPPTTPTLSTQESGEKWKEELSPTGQKIYESVSKLSQDIQTTREYIEENQELQQTIQQLGELGSKAYGKTEGSTLEHKEQQELQSELENLSKSCIEIARVIASSQEWRQIVKDSLGIVGEALMIQLEKKWVNDPSSAVTSSTTTAGRASEAENPNPIAHTSDTVQSSTTFNTSSSPVVETTPEGAAVETPLPAFVQEEACPRAEEQATASNSEEQQQRQMQQEEEQEHLRAASQEETKQEETPVIESATSMLKGLFRSNILSRDIPKETEDPQSSQQENKEKIELSSSEKSETTSEELKGQAKDKIPQIMKLDEDSQNKLKELADKCKQVMKMFLRQKEREIMEFHLENVWNSLIHWKDMRQDLTEDTKSTLNNAKNFLESKANRSMDPLLNSLMNWVDKIQSNKVWEQLKSLYRRSKNEPNFVDTRDFDDALSNWTQDFYDALHEHKEQGQEVVEEGVAFLSALPTPALIQDFRELRQDSLDLFYRVLSSASSRKDVQRDFEHDARVVWNRVSKLLTDVHIPRIQEDNPEYHLILDHLYWHCEEILPSDIFIKTETRMNTPFSSVVRVDMESIKASAKDMTWMFFKKRGLFSAGDVGTADVNLGKQGMSISLVFGRRPISATEANLPSAESVSTSSLTAASVEEQPTWVLSSCKVDLNDLNLKFHQTGHDWMYNFFVPIIKTRLKTMLEESIQDRMNRYLLEASLKSQDMKESAAKIVEKISAAAPESLVSSSFRQTAQ